jgi:hypothetical protein
MIIAKRLVAKGDTLYHAAQRKWVTVIQAEPCIVEMLGSGGQAARFNVTAGGKINGIRALAWHAPIELDLPVRDIGMYQRVLDALVKENLHG